MLSMVGYAATPLISKVQRVPLAPQGLLGVLLLRSARMKFTLTVCSLTTTRCCELKLREESELRKALMMAHLTGVGDCKIMQPRVCGDCTHKLMFLFFFRVGISRRMAIFCRRRKVTPVPKGRRVAPSLHRLKTALIISIAQR
ncbi:GPI-anchored surface protein, putative [Bodo saltans]|uniref:GPI-anchored surface protein, putative n=1 Tax=Bodo saltans TaxID=75058 RepID=A0A0S4KPI4_BODSA|nr:GPI-anchored surface protein, putative [Bodo saltans]|eukprot:CUI15543.1 GPI-anchored surface protein, putative [Bodo saltans]